MPKEVEWARCKYLESRLDWLTLAMISPTQRLPGKGIELNIEYKKQLVHYASAVAQNTVVSVVSKSKDNIISVMIMLVIVLQLAFLYNPVANPPHALLRVPNSLIIK